MRIFHAAVALLSLAGLSLAANADVAGAAERRDQQALRSLIQQHADINASQPDGTTALHWAAHWNNLEAVKLLLSAGAKPNTANRYSATPLSEAAAAGGA